MSDADALVGAFVDSVEPIGPPDAFSEWVADQVLDRPPATPRSRADFDDRWADLSALIADLREGGTDANATDADLRGDRPAD